MGSDIVALALHIVADHIRSAFSSAVTTSLVCVRKDFEHLHDKVLFTLSSAKGLRSAFYDASVGTLIIKYMQLLPLHFLSLHFPPVFHLCSAPVIRVDFPALNDNIIGRKSVRDVFCSFPHVAWRYVPVPS